MKKVSVLLPTNTNQTYDYLVPKEKEIDILNIQIHELMNELSEIRKLSKYNLNLFPMAFDLKNISLQEKVLH